MSFSKMLGLLQRKDKGYIILINTGNFYIARGKDALLLNQLLGLKLSCLETEVCKVGFPMNALEKYTKLIEEKDYSYIVYNFDTVWGSLNVVKKKDGKYKNTETEERDNCYCCSNTVRMYKKTDKYLQALADLYAREEENESKERKRK